MEEGCRLCPRQCNVDRTAGKTGYCGQSSEILVARASLHRWEEPCISGEEGSGTVFFCGCPLHCVFCQNYIISQGKLIKNKPVGRVVTIDRLKHIFLELQDMGANNINLVTGTHYISQIAVALIIARQEGLDIPVVYNTSGYERVESLRLLEGLVDIYMPDMKYKSEILGEEYSHAGDYFEVASAAIEEMLRQTGEAVFDKRGILKKGVLVRHMILPGSTRDSMDIMEYLYKTYGDKIYISLMNQYTPMEKTKNHPLLRRKITPREYEKVIDFALNLGWRNGFIQDRETADESFIPEFDGYGVTD